MMSAARTPQLLPGEQMLFNSGIHWRNLLKPGAALILSTALFFARARAARQPLINIVLHALGADMFQLEPQLASLLIPIEQVLLAVIAIRALLRIIRICYTGYFITTRRVIRSSGWLNTVTTEIQLQRCKVIDISQSIWEKLFNTGDITIATAETTLFFDDVPRVREFADIIQQQVTPHQDDIEEI